MDILPTDLEGVKIITPRRFGDDRGWFCESWNADAFAAAGLDLNFKQDNHSYSAEKGTVRGLHFQAPPFAQDKLVRVITGAVMDVAVDIRTGSPSYGQWVGVELSAENGRQLLVPKGFLHGFATLTDHVDFVYKCTDVYDQPSEGSVYFADSDLGINWGVEANPELLSGKDREDQAFAFADFKSPFEYKG
jgi:dTDP-4-dehydrorhamnose 3,5-epimerase